MKGFSITLCLGSYGGFNFQTTNWATRLCLGWVALTIYWRTDIEDMMTYLKNRAKEDKEPS